MLKLFVWTEFCPDYTDGLAFAVARTEAEAKQLILDARGYKVYQWGTLKVHSTTKRVAYAVSGGS